MRNTHRVVRRVLLSLLLKRQGKAMTECNVSECGTYARLIGKTVGRWTVISFAGIITNEKGCRRKSMNCRCDCGTISTVCAGNLASGKSQSCGCLQKEKASESNTTHGYTIGRKLPTEYVVWSSMLKRCSNPNTKQYADYGGRGISVCERWNKFENFIADMGPRPSDQHSIDRRDNDGNYDPTNCRWATMIEQQRHKRSNRIITANGKSMCLVEWAEQLGVKPRTLQARLQKGWADHDAINQPFRKSPRKREEMITTLV